MSSERAAFAKVRAQVRRELEKAEEAEHESGELNLVPYLDIVTNVVIFLLATTASVVAMANINVTAPRYSEPVAGATSSDSPKESLNLTVTVSYQGIIIAGSGAVLPGADGKLPTIKCKGALQRGRCPAYLSSITQGDGTAVPVWVDKYDYEALKRSVSEIKRKYPHERQVILMADHTVPYQIVVRVMDTLRGTATEDCSGSDGCLFDQVILSAGIQ